MSKSDKLPALQFYPGDWRKDVGVQSLSYHDRGVWFEMLMLMHESEQRGKLLLNGAPMPMDALAKVLGLDNQILTNTLTTLATYGVTSICENTGAIMCRRMVRDEHIREIRKKSGRMGGNPALVNQKSNQSATTGVKQNPTPSSSISSSTSIAPPALADVVSYGQTIGAPPPCCEAFWQKHEALGWTLSGSPITKWRPLLAKWKTSWAANDHQRGGQRTNGKQPSSAHTQL